MSTTSNPQSIKIARKRGHEEEPPHKVIVQAGRAGATEEIAVYVRKRRDVSERTLGERDVKQKGDVAFAPKKGPKNELARRLFELKRSSLGKRGRDDVATFVEQRKEKTTRSVSPGARKVEEEEVPQFAERPQKRPSRQPRTKRDDLEMKAEKPQTDEERRQMEALAEYLHEASMDEMKYEQERTRPAARITPMTSKVAAPPRISGQRAKEMHRKRMESNMQVSARQNGEDHDTDMSEGDYVYDTYVLAPFDTNFDSRPSSIDDADVGYLIIAPEDQELWERYIDDPPTEEEVQNSDEEDENAEDYYGADYPEDELSEDDEFGKGAYGYRGRGGDESDGEGYESDDAGVWSDEEDGEFEKMMNPFRYRGPKMGGVQRRLGGEEDDE